MTDGNVDENSGEVYFEEVKVEQSSSTITQPDRNDNITKVEIGSHSEQWSSIFIEVEVVSEMIRHACSDTTIELGGVLLGHYWETSEPADEDRQRKVWITDLIQAEHFEATSGSFKFTHATWQAITRERRNRDASLRILGWYHTHPNWGVFLSGMDLFICESFFNHWFDVAIVVDPIRKDVGVFQWSSDRTEMIRSSGYQLTISKAEDST